MYFPLVSGNRDNCPLGITAPYIERTAGERVSWGIRPENIELIGRKNIHAIRKEKRKNLLDGTIMSVVNKGTSRIMSLIIAESEDVLKVEVANRVFDSLKIEIGDECTVRLRTSDMIVF
ncbi:TOBE domain-containing protein [Methanosarcina mazei]|uniref:TOBE domain-containing protein n=1 Tax=Methanosarcina mazei TaxID=2209 RepID=UPI000A5D926C|nr:TOBE domain-containing protein [Methanosarcina mazei]